MPWTYSRRLIAPTPGQHRAYDSFNAALIAFSKASLYFFQKKREQSFIVARMVAPTASGQAPLQPCGVQTQHRRLRQSSIATPASSNAAPTSSAKSIAAPSELQCNTNRSGESPLQPRPSSNAAPTAPAKLVVTPASRRSMGCSSDVIAEISSPPYVSRLQHRTFPALLCSKRRRRARPASLLKHW